MEDNTIMRSIIAKNIKRVISESPYSLEEMAKRLHITDRQLWRYNVGSMDVPALVLYNLCTALDKNISDMFIPSVETEDSKI